MKFINYLESISGVSIYPLVALLIFTSVFGIALWQTFRMKREQIDEQKNIPLN